MTAQAVGIIIQEKLGDGCHAVPRMMASPERDEPRSLRKDGFAGTGQALRRCNS
jgi:hypothetical protein